MLCCILVTALLLAEPVWGRGKGNNPPFWSFKAVAKRLREAKASKSLRSRREALIGAQNLVEQLPPSPVVESLKLDLKRTLEAGVTTDEAEEAIDKAIGILEAADRLLERQPSISDPELARAKLLQVLNSPEFRTRRILLDLLRRISKWLEKPVKWLLRQLVWLGNPIGKILRPFFEWLARTLTALGVWFWHWFKFLTEISPFLAWGTVGVLGAVVVTSLAYAVLKRWGKRKKWAEGGITVQALVMPERLLKDAEIAARQGDYLTALRKAYHALLLTLDLIGLVRFREQKTNWEYLAEVSRKAPLDFAQRFREATCVFDRCFYAGKLATEMEFATVKRLAEETHLYARLLRET